MLGFLVMLLLAVSGMSGCGSRSQSSLVLREHAESAVLAKVAPKASAFAHGSCWDCANEACQEAVTRCERDPGCSVFENCLWACPVDSTGLPTAQCADECKIADNSESTTRSTALRACLQQVDCQACSAVATPSETGLDAGVSSSCRPSDPTSECNVCSWSKCCDVRGQCAAEPECDSFIDCVGLCDLGSQLCAQQCEKQLPKGRWPFEQVLACADVRCSNECGAAQDSCLMCDREACGELRLQCLREKACWEILACSKDNCDVGGDPDCIPECARRSPDGVEAFNDYLECGLLNCQAECAG